MTIHGRFTPEQHTALNRCRRNGHDYGKGRGVVHPLPEEGEVQTCVVCGSSREVRNGQLRYNAPPMQA